MQGLTKSTAFIIGLCIAIGLLGLGYMLKSAALDYKQFERSVTVKGLSEREYPADIVIWPIQFAFADNDLPKLYNQVDSSTAKIISFIPCSCKKLIILAVLLSTWLYSSGKSLSAKAN